VRRRFSDFEYLLKNLQDNVEYQSIMLPSLPDKKYIGNSDDQFIKERRHKLEGFLRHLLDQDNRIKADSMIKAFLTHDAKQWLETKKNPTSYLSQMKSLANAMATTSLSVTDIAGNLVNKFRGTAEPFVLK
jgi:hypothetical protein